MIYNQPEIINLNRQFTAFSEKIIKSKRRAEGFFIPQLQKYEKQYKRLGVVDIFSENAGFLAQRMQNVGLYDFAGIIYSHLSKNMSLSKSQRIYFMQQALSVAKKQNDDIHILARVVDLKKVYQENNDRHNLIIMLMQEEKILSKILGGYTDSVTKYRTVSRGASPQQTYKFRLATCKVDIAKNIMKKEPTLALERLLDAETIFKELERKDELNFARRIIAQIKSRNKK